MGLQSFRIHEQKTVCLSVERIGLKQAYPSKEPTSAVVKHSACFFFEPIEEGSSRNPYRDDSAGRWRYGLGDLQGWSDCSWHGCSQCNHT